jgi:hypothetical protein
MSKERGKSYALSPFRRLVVDLMHFSQHVPAVAIERRMNLAALAGARQYCSPRPTWTTVFGKAFGLVSRTYPELRRAYMPLPYPRLYEHPYSTVSLNIERLLPVEPIVLQCLIKRPENRSLAEIDAIVRRNQATPLEELRWYRRSLTMARLPWPIRRFVWWATLKIFGRERCHNFGTFSVSSIASQGAGIVHLVPVLTASLHYGLFDDDENLDVRLTFDHRVMDGATAARTLVELEHVLHGPILTELHTMRWAAAA